MPRRKGNGEGMLRQRKDGTWESRFSFTDANGQSRTKSLYGKTRREAFDKMQKSQMLLKSGRIDIVNAKYKIKEWMPFFIFTFKHGKVEYSTARLYATAYTTHIEPAFAERLLDDLRPIEIQTLVNNLPGRTAETVMLTLKESYKIANEFGYTKNNPTLHIKMPKKKPTQSRAMTNAEQQIYLDNLMLLPPAEQLLLYLPLATGVGPGEELGIDWKHIDLKRKKIRIQQSYKLAAVGNKIGDTKNTYRVRDIPINNRLFEMLNAVENKTGFLFPGLIPGKPLDLNYPSKRFKRYIRMIGLDNFTFYDMRHTFATRLMENGVKKNAARRFMGHSSSKMLDRVYEHENEDFLDDQAKIIADLF